MSHKIEDLISKSDRSFKAATKLFNEKFYDFSLSRLYYSLFYLIEALLEIKDLEFSKHGTLIGAFHKHYVETKIFSNQDHKLLHDLFDVRCEADYLAEFEIEKETVEHFLKEAQGFSKRIKTVLKNNSQKS